MPWYSK